MDRSHPQLDALDALLSSGLTYPGWEADVKAAERYHVQSPMSFSGFLAEMTRKQSIKAENRSHPQLLTLDAVVASGLTYSGWQTDVKEAERYHVKWPSSFDGFLAEMTRKQSIKACDRSDSQLCELDALVASGLTYSGWQTDVTMAEHHYVKWPSSFDGFLAEMTRKQSIKAGDRSHPQLDALVASGLTYSGWEADEKEAEHYLVKNPRLFDGFLAQMTRKQSIKAGDRSDPQLCKLDELVASGLTYSGWQEDAKVAESYHVKWPSSFDGFLTEICRKQEKKSPVAGNAAFSTAVPQQSSLVAQTEVGKENVRRSAYKRNARFLVDQTFRRVTKDDSESDGEEADKTARKKKASGGKRPTFILQRAPTADNDAQFRRRDT